MNLLEMLSGSLSQEASVNSIAKKSKSNRAQVLKLIAFALPLLLTYLTRNAKKKEGAQSLVNALGQHRNTGNIASQIEEADTEDGEKILKHILGDDEEAVTNNLAKKTGMNQSQVLAALDAILPGVMSGISASATQAGQKKKAGIDLSDGLDLKDIMGMLGGSSSGKSNGFGLESLLGGALGAGAAVTPKKKTASSTSSSVSKSELEKAKYEAELAKAKAEKAKAEAELAKLQLEQEKTRKGTSSAKKTETKKSVSGNAALESIMGQLLGGSKPTAKKSTMDGSDLLSMLSGLM